MVFSLDVGPWDPRDWPKAYATSPYMSTTSWLLFRGFVLLFLAGHLLAHMLMYLPEERWMYLIYLSRWMTCIEVIEEIFYFLAAFWGAILIENGIVTSTVPVLVKIHMALECMILPNCLLTSTLYWMFSPYLPPPYVSGAVHGGDAVLVNLSFFLGRFPYAFNKIGWAALVAWSYSLFTIIHFYLKIGTDDSAPCDAYPLNECPVYAPIDWHHPLWTGIMVSGGCLVAPPVMCGIYTGLTRLRDSWDTGAAAMREAILLQDELQESGSPEGTKNTELNCGAKNFLSCGV